ncbi:restriction endonuclease subunit S [uncultured Nostoc sp.]|uniref:restriction endonuclease subunit S n=1 Tax=uncultured Nostoc sp. TaxID=340711 RepID=UPI0035CA2EDA
MSVHIDSSQGLIPSTWIGAKLGEIAIWGSGGTPSSTVQEYYDGDIPWLVIGALNDGYVYKSKKRISEAGLENSSAKIVAPDNVLVAMYGSIGKVGINKVPVATNQAIAFTQELSPYVLNKYLFYYLLHIRDQLQSLGKGGAQKNISLSLLKEIDILLAPTREQARIVAKIDELFSEIDKGIEYLRTAQEQLKVYRQSVLKYAFEGKLTEQWREAHIDKLETADQLLERIQQERENRYQQQLNKWEEAVKVWEVNGTEGKKPTKPKMPSEITSLTEEELLQLPQLPEGWCWAKVEALGEVQLGRQRSPQNRSRDYPTRYIRAANITEDGFDFTDVMDMEFKPHELER